MKPSVGRVVHYTLSQDDAEQINRRRTDGPSIAARIKEEKWPVGAQAHIGNRASAGQVFPMIIVAVWSETCVNGQVFLDGNDTFWALSRGPATLPDVPNTPAPEGGAVAAGSTDAHGKWQWPSREAS